MAKIRYGIIGLKGVGQAHLDAVRHNDHAQLTALVDIDSQYVSTLSQQLSVLGFTDYRDMLNADVVDAVSIALPHYLHAPVAQACLEQGVHVFIEKPLANTVSEADAIIKLAQSKGLKICVGHQYRTFRTSQIMKHLIDEEMGAIHRLLWTWCEFRPQSYYTRDVWRSTWEQAGSGVLMNQASHDIDLICWMMGQPTQVSAMMHNQLQRTQLEDMVCANLIFSNGALGSLQCTINQAKAYNVRQISGERGIIAIQDVNSTTSDQDDQIWFGKCKTPLSKQLNTLSGCWDQPEMDWQAIRVSGDSTSDTFAPSNVHPNQEWKHIDWAAHLKSGTSVLMNSFLDAILTDTEPLVTADSALQTIEVINAIILSASRKKTVSLPINREEYNALYDELCQN